MKATSEKANVTASPIIVLGISEASLERSNGMRTTRLSQSYTYSQLLQQRSRHYAANSSAENTRLHDERKTESIAGSVTALVIVGWFVVFALALMSAP